MRKLLVALIAFSALATAADAQDTPVTDIAVGYSFFYVVKGLTLATNGVSGSAAFHTNDRLALVGDLGVFRATQSDLTIGTYTIGPRFSWRKSERFTPFAQVLLGGGHVSELYGGFTGLNSFVFGAGVGADFGLDSAGKFALRPQMDYFGFRANGGTTNNVRVSVGIVFRLGKKQ